MLPLRDRAQAIFTAVKEKTQAEQQRWQQNDKPALKEYAKDLKEALALQHAAVEAQQARVASLAAQPVNLSQRKTGFNVIRARLTSDGKPLPTEDLQAERDRLTTSLNQLAIDIAAAKAEIRSQRRAEEVEIWETQLVALQDTLRVYKQEINLIEVELLGREQQERIERDRQMAEASGLAQLQRLQNQALQTRIRFNRAKQQYHFPPPCGYNITFGGGGIYGALKDITLSMVHGSATITAEVLTGPHSNGSQVSGRPTSLDSQPRARLVIQFGMPNSAIGSLASSSSRASASTVQPAGTSISRHSSSTRQDQGVSFLAGDGCAPNHASSRSASFGCGGSRKDPPSPLPTKQQPSPSHLAGSAHSVPAGAAPSPSMRRASTASNGSSRLQQQLQQQQQPPPVQRKQSKAKAMAVRFLTKIGSKKDKYQGKEQPQLQPSEPSASHGTKRTLASKLLHRKQTSKEKDEFLNSEVGCLESSGLEYHSQHYSDSIGDQSEDLLGDVEAEREQEQVVRQVSSPGHLRAAASYPFVADGDDDGNEQPLTLPLTREALRNAEQASHSEGGDTSTSTRSSSSDSSSSEATGREPLAEPRLPPGFDRGSWLRQRASSGGAEVASTWGGESSVAASSDVGAEVGDSAAGPTGSVRQGVHVVGRVTGFGLVGERGSKVPNLSLGQGDVEGNVFVRFVFEYTKLNCWHPVEKPQFDVTRLKTRLRGNNVPMPDALVKTILRLAIPGLIQRKLLAAIPQELGSYLLAAQQGFNVSADVALVSAPLSVLDADLAFEVRGPARSAAEAKKEQHKYSASKEARRLLGLSLPQAQLLAELFRSKTGLLDMSSSLSIFQLIALQRSFDHQPELYNQLCQVLNTGYQLLAERLRTDSGDFNFRAFMDGPVSKMRRKPSRIRVIMHEVNVPVSLDALLTAVRDYFQRALEELFIKRPQSNSKDAAECHEDDVPLEEQLEVLHVWHAWMLQELSHFKSKFRGAGGTLLGAASNRGFSAGIENAFYEGPLRVRVPVNMQLDADGAFSFDVPLPSAEGSIGEFVDGIKSRLVPAHLRPPVGSINWILPTGDTEVDQQMQAQVNEALRLIQQVLDTLNSKVTAQGAEKLDEDPVTALRQPRTPVGDHLGRMIVNRLRVHVRLDERRISEILQGIDSRSMGSGFVATAGRILGHLGDVMTLGFTPAAPSGIGNLSTGAPQQQYLFQFESSDISRLRADVQSLGFQSLITPGGAVRLVHAVIRAFLTAFKHVAPAYLKVLDERFQGWYQHMTRESLDVSLCLDLKGAVHKDSCVVTLSGSADQALLRETSPLVAVNDLDLREAAVALFGPGAAAVGSPGAASALAAVGNK